MFIPKRTKYKKKYKGRVTETISSRTNKLNFGKFSIGVTQAGIIYSHQFKILEKIIKKTLTKKGKLWWRIFAHHQKTTKSLGTRMGKGKGNVNSYFSYIRPYQIICEFSFKTTSIKLAEIAYKFKKKLNIPTVIMFRDQLLNQKTHIFQWKHLKKTKLMNSNV